MSESIAPESRIFRIGRECYVVYLGKERDDVRPFLRIGNTRDIPDEVHEAISTTVITDDHVGNPLLEILNVPKFSGRYLGDTAVIGTMKRFFKSFDLPTEELTDYRKFKDGERRHMVWFYSSGNIHLRYDDKVIFDLDKREKTDRHFVRLYEEAKGEFLRNPLRYIRQDFANPGLILTGGNAFWFEAGDLLSFAAHPGFVARLMNDGIDPDFINSSAYDLKSDEMDSRDAAVFIGFLKRTRQRRKQLKVITAEPALQRKLKLLFPARGDTPATLDVTDVSGKKKATFRDSIISRKNDCWHIHRAGLPGIIFDGESDNGVSVDIQAATIRHKSEDVDRFFQLPQGFPISLIGHAVSEIQMTDKYGSFVLNSIKDQFNASENDAATALDRYVKLFRDDVVAGKSSLSPLLKQHTQSAKDALKNCRPGESGISWFYFTNLRSIIATVVDPLSADHPLSKNGDTVDSLLGAMVERMPPPEPILPFWGDLYIGSKPVLFWRTAKRSFSAADIAATREANEKIQQIANLDETPWHDDLQRLLQLIKSLGDGGAGPLTEDQLALLETPEEKPEKTAEKPKAAEGQSTEIHHSRDARTAVTDASKTESESRGARSETAKPRRRIWPWLLGLLLLLLLGAVIWDFSGSAPWGSIFGRTPAVPVDGPGEDGETDGEDALVAEDGQTTGEDQEQSTEELSSEDSDPDGDMQQTSEQSGGDQTQGVTTDSGDVDVDIAPRTIEDVQAYLDVDGRVAITEADIHLAANEIAVLNGYKDLDYRVFTGADPDWIYPGNILTLPDRGDYTIRSGDTIWFLAAREVRVDAERDLAIFDEALSVIDDNAASSSAKSQSAAALREIAEGSRAASLRRMANDALERRQL